MPSICLAFMAHALRHLQAVASQRRGELWVCWVCAKVGEGGEVLGIYLADGQADGIGEKAVYKRSERPRKSKGGSRNSHLASD